MCTMALSASSAVRRCELHLASTEMDNLLARPSVMTRKLVFFRNFPPSRSFSSCWAVLSKHSPRGVGPAGVTSAKSCATSRSDWIERSRVNVVTNAKTTKSHNNGPVYLDFMSPRVVAVEETDFDPVPVISRGDDRERRQCSTRLKREGEWVDSS